MFEQTRSVGALVVSMGSQVGDEGVVGDLASLGQAIHAFMDLNVYVPIVDEGTKVVLVKDGLGNEGDRDHHVFIPGHWGVEVEVLDVDCHELGIGGWTGRC